MNLNQLVVTLPGPVFVSFAGQNMLLRRLSDSPSFCCYRDPSRRTRSFSRMPRATHRCTYYYYYYYYWGLLSLLLCSTLATATRAFTPALAIRPHSNQQQPKSSSRVEKSALERLRGGQQQQASTTAEQPTKQQQPTPLSSSTAAVKMSSSLVASFGKLYATLLERRPILTKSLTAGGIFIISDYLAQRLPQRGGDNKNNKNNNRNQEVVLDWGRMGAAGLVGLLYFGPAAHYWYEAIFRLLPGTTLASTLQKAVLGQLIFGPSFTCIFFASGLMQSKKFTIRNWWVKIRQDLPGAWLAGVGYWPLVDFVSYSVIPIIWIPLFVNMCSLVWTVYLSLVSNRSASTRNA